MSHLKGTLAEGGKLYAVKCITINEYIICASSPQTVKIQVKLQKHTHTQKKLWQIMDCQVKDYRKY